MRKITKILMLLTFVVFIASCEKSSVENPIPQNMEVKDHDGLEIHVHIDAGWRCLLFGTGCIIDIVIHPMPYQELPKDILLPYSDYEYMVSQGYQLAFIEADKWEKESFELPQTLTSDPEKNKGLEIEIPNQNIQYSNEQDKFVGFFKKNNRDFDLFSRGKDNVVKSYIFYFGYACTIFGNICRVTITVDPGYMSYEDLPTDVVLSHSDYENMINNGYELKVIQSDKWEEKSFELVDEAISSDETVIIPAQNLSFSNEANGFVGFVKLNK